MLPSHSQHIRTAITFSPVPPLACATQLWPHTCPAPPYPTSTTHPLHKNYPFHHALAKTEPIQLGFQDFVPNTLFCSCHSIAAIHPLNLTLSHPNNIPPMQKQPSPPCINKNQAHMTQFSGFCPQNPLPPTSFNCGHPPTQPHLITPQPYPPYALAKTESTWLHLLFIYYSYFFLSIIVTG